MWGLKSYAQNEIDYYIEPNDTIEEKLPSDSIGDQLNLHQLQDSIKITQTDSLYQSTLEQVNDSLAQISSFIGAMEDSLQSLKMLQEIDQKRARLLDTLATLQLPPELTDIVDSLRSLPTPIRNMRSKLDIGKYQSADTFVTRYIDDAKNFIADQQQKIEEKGATLLPEKFYTKLENIKAKAGTDDMDALNKVDGLTSKYELDYKKYLSINQLQEYLDLDIDYLNDMDGYLDQVGGYSGELDTYLAKTDLHGIADIKNLDQHSNQLELPGNIQLEGIAGLEGANTDEMQKLISEYGTLDAETLDQRIDQMAGNYAEVNDLQSQMADFEGMKTEHFGEIEQLNSYASTKFDEKMALKKGQVIANEQLLENSEIVQTAMKEVEALKKKYAIVTNSNFKEEDVEKPTKHVQLKKRFFYGGDFQLLPGDPFAVDFSGLLGYKVANRTSVGVAGSIRYEFEESEDYMPDFKAEPVYGGRAFLHYSVLNAYFLQGEVEAANVYNESQRKIWEMNYLAGIGRSMVIAEKIKLNITFLYHINNKDSYAHDRPFVIRVGFSSL
ncbi:MAG: hypothetical protein HC819_23000 [Cyclobacteriaceae bacterium]|nr:hypothetical protein [Cyclobacteriaceae bacterium]